MNPKDEAKEWYEKEPYTSFDYDQDGGSFDTYDIPAIIAQARKLALQEAIEVVEKEMDNQITRENGYNKKGSQLYADLAKGGQISCDHILSKLQGLIQSSEE